MGRWLRGAQNCRYCDQGLSFKDRLRVALGGEYIPNNFTRSYLNRIRYRAGLHYGNSYLKVNGSGYKEYGATLGVGFPMLDNRSFINASFEYVKIIPDSKTLINEQYLRFTVSYTFNEYWFFKFKQDWWEVWFFDLWNIKNSIEMKMKGILVVAGLWVTVTSAYTQLYKITDIPDFIALLSAFETESDLNG